MALQTQIPLSAINPDFLLQAYQMGIFPMAMGRGEIGWFSPDEVEQHPLHAGFTAAWPELRRIIEAT